MPVIYFKWILRSDLTSHPDWIFLFGDNAMRIGLGGQAKMMRNEPNAIGIRTKWAPYRDKEAYFSDEQYVRICDMIHCDLVPVAEALRQGKTVVIPKDGLGTGLSDLPKRAPKVFEFLRSEIYALEKIEPLV